MSLYTVAILRAEALGQALRRRFRTPNSRMAGFRYMRRLDALERTERVMRQGPTMLNR